MTYVEDTAWLAGLIKLDFTSRDWKNIPEVVRDAFKAVCANQEKFTAIENQLKFIVSELNGKASKNELNTKLSNKPSHAEMNELFSKCITRLDSKLDVSESVLTSKELSKFNNS